MAEAVFTMGLPGAGKSTVSEQRYPDHHIIDADLHKERHPDYDPKNPGLIHEWSNRMMEAEFAEYLTRDDDFVVGTTGTHYPKLVRMLRQAKAAGFKTTLLYVMVPLQVALERNAKRERTVPEHIVREKADSIEVAFEINAREADHAIVVDAS